MLSIHASSPEKTTPNLLPARINHNGAIPSTNQYWKPENDDKGNPHVYFRGRHLHGTTLPLPENYTGVVLQMTDKTLPTQSESQSQNHESNAQEDEEEGEDETEQVEVKIAEQLGSFDEVVVWGHGGTVDEGEDVYVRGVREWIGFAEAMHVDEEGEGEGTSTG
ncbi:ribonuclease H1 small subunit [Amniculicola lignicola CBS 123094]|uniref:Ribonuclease H1 small subunit n=1 Tax=Amniculicola lignicola CBS 123094 TaxID=1392246 RepID=A0A6A5VV94_9PLEO|nr:ribonuclease H1 small subunit [Amniculicola lignicola CBS 123094]